MYKADGRCVESQSVIIEARSAQYGASAWNEIVDNMRPEFGPYCMGASPINGANRFSEEPIVEPTNDGQIFTVFLGFHFIN